MCGLLLTTSGAQIADLGWDSAMEVLVCRGPDSSGQVQCQSVAAGHRRLEIIGLGASGAQPFSEPPHSDLLVYNGEIYNYKELGDEVLSSNTRSDTQVLYELLRKRDWHRLSRLRGMYAFAYFDGATSELITARDPFGIKPLYVLRQPDGNLTFASVPAALAHFPGGREISTTAVAAFLGGGYVPTETSTFANIEKHDAGQIRIWKQRGGSWRYDPIFVDFSAWPDIPIVHALEDSVHAHLVADVPVGVLLSGGIDSTLIAAIAAQSVSTLRTYSLTNPANPEIDESKLARWNARLLGADHTEVPVGARDLAAELPLLTLSAGEPMADAASLPLSVLCRRVSDDLKVVLAGEGADELFGGYKRYEVERIQRDWRRRLVGPAARTLGSRNRYNRKPPSQRTRALASVASEMGLTSHSYLMGADWDVMKEALPGPTTLAWTGALTRWEALTADPIVDWMEPNRAFDTREWMPNVFLEKSDRASMLHGLEVRVPYLDPLVARAARGYMPTDTSKKPLRDELLRRLPTVRLPPNKKGLSVATDRLVAEPSVKSIIEYELQAKDSLLSRLGANRDVLSRRCHVSPNFAFRIAAVGVWAQLWDL